MSFALPIWHRIKNLGFAKLISYPMICDFFKGYNWMVFSLGTLVCFYTMGGKQLHLRYGASVYISYVCLVLILRHAGNN